MVAGVLFASALIGEAAEGTKTLDAIDTSEALRIGANSVSHYAVEKNFARAPFGKQPQAAGEAETKRWFEVFLAKQVIIAEALDRHYDTRPEVVQMVASMEQHMLAQSVARSLTDKITHEPISPERLRRIYSALAVVPEVVGVRLSTAEMSAWKGQDWASFSPDEKIRHLKMLGATSPDFYSGPLPWPYIPFPEVETDITPAVAAGTWIEHPAPETTTLIYIVSTQTKKLPPFDAGGGAFEAFVRNQLQQSAAAGQRAALLRPARIQVNATVLAKCVAALAQLPAQSPEIPKNAVDAFARETLVTYERERSAIVVTAEDWRTYYNRQFVRRLPRTAAALLETIKEMIATDFEVRQARAQGLDQTAQFTEDRRNFLHYQALDLFEKEKLLPTITVSEQSLRNYYSANTRKFLQPVAADCVEMRFESQEKAADWLKENRASLGSALDAAAVLEKSELRVSRDSPAPNLPSATDAILHLPDGAFLGPTPSAKGWIVILKRSSDTRPLPYEAVASQIRALWIRERLDDEEVRLAPELCAKYEVHDAIPYAKFGVPESLLKPWK